MKQTIQSFIDEPKIAIVGASKNKDNFGKYLLEELTKQEYEVHPVNPKCEEINGISCVPTVKELPDDVEGAILAVPNTLTLDIVRECINSPIRRVWMVKGVGTGAYSEEAHNLCKESGIEVVYGFCPMMFFGKGGHKFHLWIRKTFGKVPAEYMN